MEFSPPGQLYHRRMEGDLGWKSHDQGSSEETSPEAAFLVSQRRRRDQRNEALRSPRTELETEQHSFANSGPSHRNKAGSWTVLHPKLINGLSKSGSEGRTREDDTLGQAFSSSSSSNRNESGSRAAVHLKLRNRSTEYVEGEGRTTCLVVRLRPL